MAESVSKATREVLRGLSFLNYAFERKLINESALARFIKERVEEKTGRPASQGSITAAVRRFMYFFEPTKREKNFFELLKSARISLKTGVAEAHFKRSQNAYEKLSALEKKVNWAQGEKMFLLQRAEELTVVADKTHYKEILYCAPSKRDILSSHDNRALITITCDPYYFAESFGVLHFFTGQFAYYGISIYLIFSTYSATSFVINEKDAALAYKNLSSSIAEISRLYGERKAPKLL